MDGKTSNVTHAAASILGIAIPEIESGTITPQRIEQLKEVQRALRGLCFRCIEDDSVAKRNTPTPTEGERNE